MKERTAAKFVESLAKFASVTAAMNARALHRAGVLDDFEIGVMHAFLGFSQEYAEMAESEDYASHIETIREILPPEPGLPNIPQKVP